MSVVQQTSAIVLSFVFIIFICNEKILKSRSYVSCAQCVRVLASVLIQKPDIIPKFRLIFMGM